VSTFSVRFLGCKVSQADATLIRDALVDAGHVETVPERAEVHVVNTCALTQEAERKSRRQVNRAAREGRTFVTGCAANLNGEQFAAPGVTAVGRSADRAAAEIVGLLGGAAPACPAGDAPPPAGRTRAFLKVQNGCDARCAFCIIPTTRGPAESRPLEAVLRDARRRLAEGHPELVLTGINIGTYRDPASGTDLADVVRAVGALDGLARLRISSIEPGDVTDRLLSALAETPAAGRHLHVPLQSGDPRVLRDMRRGYGPEEYLDAAARARRLLPGLNLTTDAIVGFPGEDDAAHTATEAVLDAARVTKVHVFPYSPRPGTDAASMDDHVPNDVKRERSRRLRDRSDRAAFAHRVARVGSRDRVLVESLTPDGHPTGLGADYTRFVLPTGGGRPGDMVDVEVTAMVGEHLMGQPIEEGG
jgi:threonylcarbamoyladenosine tRNA methylthiotransferase MtaB